MPLVSVLLPVKGGAHLLKSCLTSLAAQTFSDFEIVLVDDHTPDDSVKEVAVSYPGSLRYFSLPRGSTGVAAALNYAFLQTDAPLLARADGDDVYSQERLELQVNFLKAHEAVDILGSCVTAILPNGSQKLWNYPEEDNQIRKGMLLRNTIAHPSVMLRRKVLDSQEYRDLAYEDYDLWLRCLKYFRFYNLQKPLMMYTFDENRYKNSLSVKQLQLILSSFYQEFEEALPAPLPQVVSIIIKAHLKSKLNLWERRLLRITINRVSLFLGIA